MTERILLIHGIWNHRTWLQPLAVKLRRVGFDPLLFSYDSVLQGPNAALPDLVDMIQRAKPSHLVGHSLGGLLALEALRWAPGLPIKRVACLGSPLRGSQAARHMAQHIVLKHALGRSAELLTRGFEQWTGPAEVGVVAGVAPRGLGQWITPLQGPSDGTVLLSETQLPGLSAHCTVSCGHTELAFAQMPAKRVAQFLQTGGFED